MADVEISIFITQHHAELMREAVESGAYASGGEVIREALDEWSAKWFQKRNEIAKLQALWNEGKASGSATAIDFDEARAEF